MPGGGGLGIGDHRSGDKRQAQAEYARDLADQQR
jgi:hypothetical protein